MTTSRPAGVIVKMLDRRFSPWARWVEFETTLHSRSFLFFLFFCFEDFFLLIRTEQEKVGVSRLA